MKAKINFNNELINFNTIKDLKTFLNSALYYSSEVFLTVDFSEVYKYTQVNDIASLVMEARFYEKPLFVSQSFERVNK
tara:strand:- start:20 stop:253 length:234 start_codon:yes stop_codon:yes gene_type:complete